MEERLDKVELRLDELALKSDLEELKARVDAPGAGAPPRRTLGA